jgi:predicted phage terminase large subunit-like protein
VGLRVIALDPSKGGTDKVSDFSAYVLLARGKTDGLLYVEADLENRRDVSRIVRDGLAHAKRFGPHGFGVEGNAFQFMLADELVRQSRAEGIALPIYKINNTVNKQVRIRTLTPYLVRREFRWVDTPGTRILVQQMRDFPVGAHDDGPDALEMALRLAVELHNSKVRR